MWTNILGKMDGENGAAFPSIIFLEGEARIPLGNFIVNNL